MTNEYQLKIKNHTVKTSDKIIDILIYIKNHIWLERLHFVSIWKNGEKV